MSKRINLTGLKFGRLTVLSRVVSHNANSRWLCKCDCGTWKVVIGGDLRSENTRSCGCLQKEIAAEIRTTHGQAGKETMTPEYRIWLSMKDRCNNPKNKFYSRYGGRGIKVCSAWNDSFETFFQDIGARPTSEHSLDRFPDNNGHYEPSNCRWATDFAQNRNKRNNQWLEYNGQIMTVADFILQIGYTGKKNTIYYHFKTKSAEEVAAMFKLESII